MGATSSCTGDSRVAFTGSDAAAGAAGGGVGGAGGDQNDAGVNPAMPCSSDKQCTPFNQLCDPARSVCVECLASADCGANHECQRGACVAYTPCTSSLQCAEDQVCDTSSGRCVQCLTNADCGANELCLDRRCRLQCMSNEECRAQSQLCDTAQNTCVDCLVSSDCGLMRYCADSTCVDQLCAPRSSVCQGNAVATCNAEGSGYSAIQACPTDTLCSVSGGTASCSTRDGGPPSCSMPTVWFLVSRSGAMFTAQFADQAYHWDEVVKAFDPQTGPLASYGPRLRIGLATYSGEASGEPACPDFQMVPPQVNNVVHGTLAPITKPVKGENPTATAYLRLMTEVVQDAAPGPEYIVIIANTGPDRCNDPSTYCAQDDLYAYVQGAHAAGIRTLIIGLPNIFDTEGRWSQFLQDVANAGTGLGVPNTATPGDLSLCGGFKASYISDASAPGSAAFFAPTTGPELSAALGAVLQSIACPQ